MYNGMNFVSFSIAKQKMKLETVIYLHGVRNFLDLVINSLLELRAVQLSHRKIVEIKHVL